MKDYLKKLNLQNNNKYCIAFISLEAKKLVFLAYNADISKICYMNPPYIPGTNNILKAKLYDSVDEAKTDIYRLRYYHRDFISLISIVKKLELNDIYDYEDNIIDYALDSFERKELQ